MSKLIGESAVPDEVMATIKERGGTWAAYQCMAMDSSRMGEVRYLKYGEGCTFDAPPEKYPGPSVIDAMTLHVGTVNIDTGEIVGSTM